MADDKVINKERSEVLPSREPSSFHAAAGLTEPVANVAIAEMRGSVAKGDASLMLNNFEIVDKDKVNPRPNNSNKEIDPNGKEPALDKKAFSKEAKEPDLGGQTQPQPEQLPLGHNRVPGHMENYSGDRHSNPNGNFLEFWKGGHEQSGQAAPEAVKPAPDAAPAPEAAPAVPTPEAPPAKSPDSQDALPPV